MIETQFWLMIETTSQIAYAKQNIAIAKLQINPKTKNKKKFDLNPCERFGLENRGLREIFSL